MACIPTWNIKDHFSGDTFKAKILTLQLDDETPIDITGCTFLMQFRKEKIGVNDNPVAFEWSSEDDSFEITDAENGKLQMNKKVITADFGNYVSDLQMTLANGDIQTLFSAKMKIIQDISRP